MELNEMEKKLLFQVEGDYQTKILNELYMTVRIQIIPNSGRRQKVLWQNFVFCQMQSAWTW